MRKPTLILILCLAGFTLFQVGLNALARDSLDPWSEAVPAMGPARIDSVLDASSSWVLVHVWAPDHPACDRMRSHVNRTAEVFAGNLPLIRIDISEHPDWAETFNIDHLPAYVLFTRGQEVARRSGHLPSGLLTEWATQITGIQPDPDSL